MIWKLLIGSHGATWHSKELGWLGLVKTTKSALLGVRTLSGTWSARTTAGGVGRGEVLAAVRPARHIRYAACRGWTGPRTRSTLPHDTGRLDSCAWQCCGVAHVMCAGTSSSNDTYAAATAGFASPDAFRGGSGGTGDPSAHVVRGTSPGRPEPRPQQKPAASLAPGAGDKPPKNFRSGGISSTPTTGCCSAGSLASQRSCPSCNGSTPGTSCTFPSGSAKSDPSAPSRRRRC